MLEAINSLDRFAQMRNALQVLAEHAEEYAGLPIGIEGEQLVIEPSYRWASVFAPKPEPEDTSGAKVRNVFWSSRWRTSIAIVQEKDGVIWHAPVAPANHATQDLSTLGCSFAWGIEQEQRALKLLGTLIRHHTFKTYLLTGMFLETSERSHVTYLFRKLRPTIAIVETAKGTLRILCAMCMHPIGYYAGSWAGAMCPTDDVIAHLMLMRGDEHMFWRRCNQHPPTRQEAGL